MECNGTLWVDMIMRECKTLKKVFRSIIGLFIAAFGQNFTIQASIGYFPWDVMSMGLVLRTGISYGTITLAIGVIVVALDLLMNEHIGIGTLLDCFFYGYMVDFWRWTGIMPVQKVTSHGILVLIIGLFVIAYGQYFYMSAGLSCGPRDAFLIALGKRLKRMPIGAVNVLIFAVVLSIGYSLGGMVGIGTLIATFGMGLVVQIVFNLVHFEPRDIVHENVITSVKHMAKEMGNEIRQD